MKGRVWYESTQMVPVVRRAEHIDDADMVVVQDVPTWIEWLELDRRIHDAAAAARRAAGPIDRTRLALFA